MHIKRELSACFAYIVLNIEVCRMTKIVFIGLKNVEFASKIFGDCIFSECLCDMEFVIVDDDQESLIMHERWLKRLNNDANQGRATVSTYSDRRRALKNADYVVLSDYDEVANAYVLKDFEIPMKYGLKQTYADTVGVGGIFRGLRAIPKILEIANDIMEICPDAWLLNYKDPMNIVVGALSHTGVKVMGLCHSVQDCVPELLEGLGMESENVLGKIAGINHQAWLLEISKNGEDIYPEIKERALKRPKPHNDMVRYDIMNKFGYYVTESSEHFSEYTPYYLKKNYPELLVQFGINTELFRDWEKTNADLVENIKKKLESDIVFEHSRTSEYVSYIIEAVESNSLYKVNANIANDGLISNLPSKAIVEVPCVVDGSGILPCHIGNLPTQLAALNIENINVHLLTLEAALNHRKENIYYAALLDPHTSAELPTDTIIKMCDELIEINQPWLWDYE